ncbi:NAD-dependent epimerase/dehydratase family protein [Ramlibacter rhizophilus]|uniref:NAD-dependent epimerase/dehydratase family protein n=1 Tax=Ramlibacter rhizophilus TaxID=1781167 RepID=A0A4Z0BK45_9BURK|nr:NAD-dependent epimerase/dehydratase family protein [Ramlibacter rhizophilus]TFY99682.1 NAD-dependent epimerase/dehydratase family protein [Ramlibacter rhizophilus]
MSRILITGGAGCLGSNLIEHWLPQGHQFLVLDNFATGKREVVPDLPGLQLREGHVADRAFVEQAFADFKPDLVIHSAASYKDPADWQEDALTNVTGSIEIARASERHGVRRVVNFQTVLSYGRTAVSPIPVTHPSAPFTSYGISKTAGEQYMLQAAVPVVSLRLANVTGPRLAIGPIPTFYKRLKAGQKCFCSDTARDFLDMSDFLAMMDLAVRPDAPTGVFNVASGEAHAIKEIFELVAAHLGVDAGDVPVVPPAADDVPVVALDASATTRAFGWTPKLGFEDTIRKQLQWYDRHGVTDIYSHLSGKS